MYMTLLDGNPATFDFHAYAQSVIEYVVTSPNGPFHG